MSWYPYWIPHDGQISSEGDSLVSGIDFGDRGELDAGAANTGYKFVSTREGTLIRVPENWEGRVADNGRGVVYQEPGAFGNGNMIRIMDPTPAYPRGYVVYYNEYGQPLDVFGRPAQRAFTHIPVDYSGPIPGWP